MIQLPFAIVHRNSSLFFQPTTFSSLFSSIRFRVFSLCSRYKESGAPKIVRQTWKRGYARVKKVYYACTWWSSGGKDTWRRRAKALVRRTNTERRNHGTSKNSRWGPSDGARGRANWYFSKSDTHDSSPSLRVSKKIFGENGGRFL